MQGTKDAALWKKKSGHAEVLLKQELADVHYLLITACLDDDARDLHVMIAGGTNKDIAKEMANAIFDAIKKGDIR